MLTNSNYPSPNQNVGRIVKRSNKKLRIFLWSLLTVVVGLVGWVSVTGILALNNISAKNTNEKPSFFKFGGNVNPDQLASEGDSRINILSIGIDNAAGLTDSIQIVSLDPINKSISILSIPRDLYVSAPGIGKTKINAVYNSTKKTCTKKTASCDPEIDYGAEALKSVVEANIGVHLHYFAKVDFEGLVRIVNAIGGLDVDVKTTLRDPEFPCTDNPNRSCGYTQPAGHIHMTGEQVLKYSRCRKGNCGNDFGRAERQQQVMLLLRDKLTSADILANPKKLTSIISIVGTHFRTDLSVDEMVKLFNLVKEAHSKDATTAVLDNDTGPLKSSVNSQGQYILIPKKGENDWSEVKDFAQSVMPEPYLVKEAAKVVIINATGKESNSKKYSDKLKALGYNVVETRLGTTQTKTTVSANTNKPYTVTLLKKRFSASEVKKPDGETADIVITIGSGYLGN